MIKHLVMWQFKDNLSLDERKNVAGKLKGDIEALQGQIPGIISLKVVIDALPTSNRDILLDSAFTSVEALAAYQIHPLHQAVAAYLGTVADNRACLDYVDGK